MLSSPCLLFYKVFKIWGFWKNLKIYTLQICNQTHLDWYKESDRPWWGRGLCKGVDPTSRFHPPVISSLRRSDDDVRKILSSSWEGTFSWSSKIIIIIIIISSRTYLHLGENWSFSERIKEIYFADMQQNLCHRGNGDPLAPGERGWSLLGWRIPLLSPLSSPEWYERRHGVGSHLGLLLKRDAVLVVRAEMKLLPLSTWGFWERILRSVFCRRATRLLRASMKPKTWEWRMKKVWSEVWGVKFGVGIGNCDEEENWILNSS